ncbi:MAG: SdpI family protein [Methanobrevibacter sp.]|nr:SdpI family protein [Methanobrevibacter sp.]
MNMKINKYVLVIAILNFIAIILMTLRLPDIVPLHIGFTGAVNLFGSKWFIPAIGMIPILFVILYNFWDERHDKLIGNENIKDQLLPILTFFFMVIPWILVVMALADSTALNSLVAIFISGLLAVIFIILSYFIRSIEPNRFVGIRTPRTLKNETVWRKTNKLGSYLFLIGGLIVLASSIIALITNNTYYLMISWIITIPLIVIVPVFYSYYI